MLPEEKVISFFILCNRLKDIVRTGWTRWHVNRERVESVAEHIYSTQMLAIAMKSEFNYDLDIKKVIYMLAIHEMEEILIGDLTPFEITREEKQRLGHEAIEKVLSNLEDKEYIKSVIIEYDGRKTKEAYFAYQIDKLECDLQCKKYDEEGCVKIDIEKDEINVHDEEVLKLLKEGKRWSEMWITHGLNHTNYDDNFRKVLEYAKNNSILELKQD